MKKLLALSLSMVLGLSGYALADGEKIAVIPKGTTHSFWKSVEAGARKAGEEFKVEVIWKGPLKEDDRAAQIDVVEQFIASGVKGIVLAPLDDKALKGPVDSAKDSDIPVVIFDSPLKGEAGKDFVSLVATDNKKGGELAGEELARILGNKGKVVLLRYSEGSASTANREAGFLDAIKKHPDIQIILDNAYGGATVDSAKDKSMQLIDKLKEADGVFCPNESSTMGMLLALQDNNLAGKIKFVGFDASPKLLEALNKGEIQALVAQNPTKMGYLAVKTITQKIRGEKVEPLIDTGCALVNKDTLNTPEVKEVLGTK